MRLSFHGAAQGVTGSCHLLECAGKRILVDCGFYQGGRELEDENANDFGFDPASIDFLLLTHAHLDHCGRIPLLIKRGFNGEIITTAASRELARLIMLDAAGLQEEEARYQARRARKRGKSSRGIVPLYTTLDALNALEYFGRTAQYNQTLSLAPGIQATFNDAGHILGSACILLEVSEDPDFQQLLLREKLHADPASDYTVRAYVDELVPWSYLDGASTFVVMDPATPSEWVDACVIEAYADGDDPHLAAGGGVGASAGRRRRGGLRRLRLAGHPARAHPRRAGTADDAGPVTAVATGGPGRRAARGTHHPVRHPPGPAPGPTPTPAPGPAGDSTPGPAAGPAPGP